MREKLPLSDRLLIQCLKDAYGLDVIRLAFLPVGADPNGSAYRAETRGHRSYFVKVKRELLSDIASAVAELLHKAGIEQVIAPVKTVQGGLVERIEGFAVIVYPFVEGQDGFSSKLTDRQWIEFGRALRQVHEVDVPLSIEKQIRRESYSSKWRDIVRSSYSHLEAEPSGDEIGVKAWKFMKENLSAIQRLVDGAEKLAREIEGKSSPFVLCHSDIHGGNVLLGKNEAIYLVDWDDPILAPKERDLMFIGGGVCNVWNLPSEEKLFYQGYGKADVDWAILAYYRHERIVEDIAFFIKQLVLSRAGGEDRPEMYKQCIDLFEPRGVVDIAFRSYHE